MGETFTKHVGFCAYRFSKSGLLLLCLCLCFQAATAQKDTVSALKQVTITSSQQTHPQNIMPAQHLGADEFKQYSAYNIADAIRNFTGVTVRDYGGIGGLKTISVRSLGAEHTAVLYDGVAISDAQNGQIDLSKFNLENIQQVALYIGQPPELCQTARAFASASVLSIVPLHPHLSVDKPYQITAGFKTGSFGLANPYVQWQQRLSDHWLVDVNTNLQYANGRYKYRTSGTGVDSMATRRNAGIRSLQTDAALYWIKSDSNKFTLRVNEYAASQGLPGAVIAYSSSYGQHLWTNGLFAQATYQRIWKSSLQLLLNSKFSTDYTHYIDPQFLNTQHLLSEVYKQHEFYQSASLSYHITHNWEVGYATDIAYAGLDINAYNYSYPTRLTLLNVLSTKLLLGKWLFEGNILNTYVNDRVQTGTASPSRNIYSPTIEAAWRPLSKVNLQLKAFYKDIFRYPTFNDLYYSEIGQRSVRPEFARQYNLGADFSKSLNGFIEFVSASTNVFYNNVTDKIIAIPTQNAFIWSIVNYGKVDIRGIEANVKAQTKTVNYLRFSLAANYTYQQALNITDPTDYQEYNAQIPYTPRQVLAVNVGVSYKQLSIYYNQIASSHRYYLGSNDPAYELPAYSVSDLSVNYSLKLAGKPTRLSAEINNLFDKQYQVIRSFPMPGTSVRFTFQITI